MTADCRPYIMITESAEQDDDVPSTHLVDNELSCLVGDHEISSENVEIEGNQKHTKDE